MNRATDINQNVAQRLHLIGAALIATCMTATALAQNVPVQVVVDMDPVTPGIQSTVQVRQCETVVQNIAVYVRDPLGQRTMYSIGYIGAIDRGISFGHTPSNNVGTVMSMAPSVVSTVNPGNSAYASPAYIPAFAGPEVIYLEMGADTPSAIPANPAAPIFTVNVTLANAHPGDAFHFYLLDYVNVWTFNMHGAFSTTAPINSLDCGGDSVPDQTMTTAGVDPDDPIPSPPASFYVDYVDGPITGGGAVIQIIPKLGDINADAVVNASDLLSVIAAWGPCAPDPPCAADINNDGSVNVADLLLVISNWGGCD